MSTSSDSQHFTPLFEKWQTHTLIVSFIFSNYRVLHLEHSQLQDNDYKNMSERPKTNKIIDREEKQSYRFKEKQSF